MGARLIYNGTVLAAVIGGSFFFLWLLAKGLAWLAIGKAGRRWDRVKELYFPKMENDRAEADNRDYGNDRRDHLPQ